MAAEIGAPAPAFTLKNQTGDEVSLESLRGRKTLVVFIPFPFTGICEGEVCAIRDNLARLEATEANVVVITCDTRPANKAWSDQQGFEFPILSDFWPHGAVASAYGCFNDKLGCAMRATYVLDAEGVVRAIVSTEELGQPRDFASYTEALASI